MFQDLTNPRQIRRVLMDKAHEIGLTAVVVCRKEADYLEVSIGLEMNKNRFNSYCHREEGNLVMSPEARVRQVQAESSMMHAFWNDLSPALVRAKKRIQWYANVVNGSERKIYDIIHGSYEELRLNEPTLFGRTIRIYP